MTAYQTKVLKFAGTSYAEVSKKAHKLLGEIEKRTKRQPYIRSSYFKKEKVFLNYFWPHLKEKRRREQMYRLKYLPCAIELIESSRQKPSIIRNPNRKDEIFYRFVGMTPEKEIFYVQIKADKKGAKYFMSVFSELWFND